MAQTPLLVKPTLEMVKLQASKIGLPPREAEKFWHHYEMVGWVWGRGRLPIKNWHSALQGWKLHWQDGAGIKPKAKTIVQTDLSKELDRIERRK